MFGTAISHGYECPPLQACIPRCCRINARDAGRLDAARHTGGGRGGERHKVWDPCARPTASLCAPPRPSSHPPLLSPPSLQLEHQLRQGALNMQALAFHCQVRGGGGEVIPTGGLILAAADQLSDMHVSTQSFPPSPSLSPPPAPPTAPPAPPTARPNRAPLPPYQLQGPAASLKLLASVAAEAASNQLTSAGERGGKGGGESRGEGRGMVRERMGGWQMRQPASSSPRQVREEGGR